MERRELVGDLKSRLLNAVGKYSDYRRYWLDLSNLEEEYDETLELYNYDIWIGSSNGTIRDKASHMLGVTVKLFSDMERNAQKELGSVLKEIMQLGKAEQRQIWNQEIFLDPKEITDERLDAMLLEWEDYPYNQQEVLKSFENFLAAELQRVDCRKNS